MGVDFVTVDLVGLTRLEEHLLIRVVLIQRPFARVFDASLGAPYLLPVVSALESQPQHAEV